MTPNSRSYLNHFSQPDSIVPTSTQGTQAWDRYAYSNNNPVRYNDPTGHWASGDEDQSHEQGHSDPCAQNGYLSQACANYLKVPSLNIRLAISYIQDSPIGKSLYDFALSKGYKFANNGSYPEAGWLDTPNKTIWLPGANSPQNIAGAIAHEAMHIDAGVDSLLQEYCSYAVGSAVENEVVQAGHGSFDMITLDKFTVNVYNYQSRDQLATDLTNWFIAQGLGYYVEKGYPALPLMPLPYLPGFN